MKTQYQILRGILAFLLAAGTTVPATAMPAFSPKAQATASEVLLVRHGDKNRVILRRNHAYWRGHRATDVIIPAIGAITAGGFHPLHSRWEPT